MPFRYLFRIVRCSLLRIITSIYSKKLDTYGSSCLVIAPHPDDEVLGCGGLILKYRKAYKSIYVVFLTAGEASHRNCCSKEDKLIAEARRDLGSYVAKIIDIPQENLFYLNWEDGLLPHPKDEDFHARVNVLSKIIEDINPETVLCPHPFEEWSDHIAAEEIAQAAIKKAMISCELLYYCVWFWFSMPLRRAFRVDWRKARLLDIRGVYSQKQAAMVAYLEPCAPCGNPWSGVLPKELKRAFNWKKELFFEADVPAIRYQEEKPPVV